jgi:5-methylcytosine-specific restriction endonuclease McrA
MSKVFVLDSKKHPLDPVHPGRARILLSSGQAAVYHRYPFTIVLKQAAESSQVQPLRLKLDPGARTTGLALVNDANGEVVAAFELQHRGTAIKAALAARRAARQSRRRRHTRYREPRFQNRRRRAGWLPPSLESRLSNILTWVQRLISFAPLRAISLELVKFDMQVMENPGVHGVEYQQGERAGYELREYLLEKWGRKCAYCGEDKMPLQVEHIQPRSRGGTSRTSNLTLACDPCNKAKGSLDVQDFLRHKPEVLKRILAHARAPLADAAAVNASRWALHERLKALELPIECGSGGLTKYNRSQRNVPKSHWLDAVCVGTSTPHTLQYAAVHPWLIAATGHGNRQMSGVNRYGFPIRHRQRRKRHYGFQTGDLVRAVVPTGKYAGVHVGRVLVRATGSFDITTRQGRVQGINARYCQPLHRSDGYSYVKGAALPLHA